jgi:ATP-dependent exoDNAse (exonuclease V) beta subunit
LDDRTAGLIRLHELDLFANSSLLREMLDAREIYRELRFHLRLPAADFTTDEGLKEKLGDETLYVQGVIDAVICHSDGTITLVDYKTDRLTREELADRRLAEAKLRARHGGQLQYYTAAIERIFGVPPRSVLLYSLPLGDTITL